MYVLITTFTAAIDPYFALMIMCLVCQQIRDVIWSGQGMENKLVRIFALSSLKNSKYSGDHRVRRFLSNMNRYFHNVSKTRILQGFQHWKVQGMKEFFDDDNYEYINDDKLEQLTHNIRMTGIVSLDLSLSLPLTAGFGTLQRAILFMVPNLHELDLPYTKTRSSTLIRPFAVRCPRLEIIRWNCNADLHGIDARGRVLDSLNTLKELYFDNCYLAFNYHRLIDENGDFIDVNGDDDGDGDNGVTEMEAMSDSNNYPEIFFFCRLCDNPLERISLRNARYKDFSSFEDTIPQDILMKFVRNAPATLVWFRSDLSATNIRILQSERPEIQFLN